MSPGIVTCNIHTRTGPTHTLDQCVCWCVRERALSIRSCSPHPCYSSSFFPAQTFRPHILEHSGTFRTSHGIHPSILLTYVRTHLHTHSLRHTYSHTASMPAQHFLSRSGGNSRGGGQGAEEGLQIGEHPRTCTECWVGWSCCVRACCWERSYRWLKADMEQRQAICLWKFHTLKPTTTSLEKLR